MAIILSKRKLKELVLNIPYEEPHIFSVVFIKRTTGEIRKMVCRRGVRSHLRGGELPYNARSYSLLPVFDMQKNEYRCINCEDLLEVKYAGVHYRSISYHRKLKKQRASA